MCRGGVALEIVVVSGVIQEIKRYTDADQMEMLTKTNPTAFVLVFLLIELLVGNNTFVNLWCVGSVVSNISLR